MFVDSFCSVTEIYVKLKTTKNILARYKAYALFSCLTIIANDCETYLKIFFFLITELFFIAKGRMLSRVARTSPPRKSLLCFDFDMDVRKEKQTSAIKSVYMR